jgi:hypothetical protein
MFLEHDHRVMAKGFVELLKWSMSIINKPNVDFLRRARGISRSSVSSMYAG